MVVFVLIAVVLNYVFSFFPVLHHTRRCLETCQAIVYPICLNMVIVTAVYPGTALHRGTAFAACHHHCTTRLWVLHRLISGGPCAMTPCGIYLNGSKDRPMPGSRGSTTIWPVPKPWSTCQNMSHQCTQSPLRPPTVRCPCMVVTLHCGPTTCSALVPRCLLPSIDESWALTDGKDHN